MSPPARRGAAPVAAVAESAVPDVLGPGLRAVFCGINPGFVSAAAAAHFANPRNDFWRLLHAAGFTSRLYEPHEQFEVLREGSGLTNGAPRTTRGSGDLRTADFAGAAERLERLPTEPGPQWVARAGEEGHPRAVPRRAGPRARRGCSCCRRRRRRTRRCPGRSGFAGFARWRRPRREAVAAGRAGPRARHRRPGPARPLRLPAVPLD